MWERSRASSSPRWVGLPPTMTAPARAAAPIQKTNSGTLSSSRATWNGPGWRSDASSGGPLGLGRHHLVVGPRPVGEGQPDPVVAGPPPDQLVDGLHRFPLGRAGRSGHAPARAAESRCTWPIRGRARHKSGTRCNLSNSPCTVNRRQCGARGAPPRWSSESFSTATCPARRPTIPSASTRCSSGRSPTSSRPTSTTGSTPGSASTTR